MKAKILLLSTAFVFISAAGVFAQGIQLGVKGGVNYFKLEGQSFNQQFAYGYSLGGFAELNFTKHLGLQPEVIWNQANTQTSSEFNVIYQGASYTNVTLNYLSIPLLINYHPIKILSFIAGPQFGILINQNDNLFDNGKQAFKKGDVSLLGGVQLNLAWFKLGARYMVGLNNINSLGSSGGYSDKWTNQGYQLYVGIRII
jgi:hypothetical protein